MEQGEVIRAAKVMATRAMFFVDALEGMENVLLALDRHAAAAAVADVSIWWAIHGMQAFEFLRGCNIELVTTSPFEALAMDAALLHSPVAGHA